MKTKNVLIPIIITVCALIVGAMVFFVVGANSPEKKLTRQLDLGAKYISEENYEQAIAAFDVAIAIDPKNVDAYLGKAEAYGYLGDYDAAIDTLLTGYGETEDSEIQKALEDAVRNRVEEFTDNGDVEGAIEFLEGIQDDINEDIFADDIEELKKDEGTTDTLVDGDENNGNKVPEVTYGEFVQKVYIEVTYDAVVRFNIEVAKECTITVSWCEMFPSDGLATWVESSDGRYVEEIIDMYTESYKYAVPEESGIRMATIGYHLVPGEYTVDIPVQIYPGYYDTSTVGIETDVPEAFKVIDESESELLLW